MISRTRSLANAALGLLMLAPSAAAAEDVDPYWLDAIPSEYHGRWNSNAQACAPFTGRGRIEISGRRLVVAGDMFEASYISSRDPGGVGVVSRYAGSAKPSWTRVDFLKLSADGKRMVNDHGRRKHVLYRCGAR